MTKKANEFPPLPGLDAVGRGISLKPYQTYELKDVLFKRETTRPYYSKETQQTYHLPEGYEVNDSPPMPSKQALNQVLIEESWERLDKSIGLDASAAGSGGLFSVDASAVQASQLSSKEDSYYALRSSFIPFWAVYVPNVTNLPDDFFDVDVPVPFRHAGRRAYERFFERYGTHYVKRAWVGGKAILAFTIAKSTNMTKEEIQLGINASYGVGSAKANSSRMEEKEKLKNNSECTVFGKGGEELKLAALSSLDETSYNQWLETIKTNPQIIEFEVAGIWTLIPDEEKANAVMEAYKAAATYETISAGAHLDNEFLFIRKDKYFCYDLEKHTSRKPEPLVKKWPVLSQCGFESTDAMFRGPKKWPPTGEDLSRKLFMFHDNMFLRLDIDSGEIDEGHPKSISEQWPGMPFHRIDAAMCDNIDSVYFFAGSRYARYDLADGKIDDVYPEPISKRWAGVNFDRIDAVISGKESKVFFFRDELYIRYDMTIYQADPGYPKYIVGSYVEDWKFLN